MENQITQISLDLLDDPAHAVRSELDDESINELAADIKRNGLIQPIIVVKRNDRYEVIAGHRRTAASRRAGLVKIPAIVRELTDKQALAVKMSENLYRRDVDLLDEAGFYAELVMEMQMPVSEIAETIGRSEAYVQSRLDIISYPQSFHEALAAKKVTLGVAQELVKIDDEHERETLLQYAIKDGVSVQNAKNWVIYYFAQKQSDAPKVFAEMAPAEVRELGRTKIVCARCNQGAYVSDMVQVWIHRGVCSVQEEVKQE